MENTKWMREICAKIDVSSKRIRDRQTSDKELLMFSTKAIRSHQKDTKTERAKSVLTSVPKVDAATVTEEIRKSSRGARKRQQRKKSKSDDMLIKSAEPLAPTLRCPVISLLPKDGDKNTLTHTVISSMLNMKSDFNKLEQSERREYMHKFVNTDKVNANPRGARTGSYYIVAINCDSKYVGAKRFFTVPSNLTTVEVKLRGLVELGLSADTPLSLTHDGIVIPENLEQSHKEFGWTDKDILHLNVEANLPGGMGLCPSSLNREGAQAQTQPSREQTVRERTGPVCPIEPVQQQALNAEVAKSTDPDQISVLPLGP